MARKGWEDLSPAYRRRLLSHGITPESYSGGVNIQSARGHRATPEHLPWKKRAERFDINAVIPDFESLPRREQETIAQDWVQGFMSKGQGSVKNPKRKKGERIKRAASDAQIIARQRFLRFQDEYGTESLDSSFWKRYRQMYAESFA